MTTANRSHWYAVQTRAREEHKALSHLKRQNYQAYLPLYTKKIRHARKSVQVVRPYFPRYLFVNLNLSVTGWRPIRSTVGVSHIVCFGDQPAPIPIDVIEGLRSQENSDGFVQIADTNSFKAGDSVIVLGGPFARQLGICQRVSDDERVSILLDLLGRKVRVLLDTDAVAAA
jgi:transcriptional antiterminator RfaH